MNSEGSPEKKRGRKRQCNEESMTPAEKEKKEKNRLAAQKCREKKERIMVESRQKNEELKRENKKLFKEKTQLFEKAENYKKIIQDHCNKGCKIPAEFLEMWNKQKAENGVNEHYIDEDRFHVAETLETSSSTPSSPDSSYSETLSPKLQSGVHENCGTFSVTPTALFSGTPLAKPEMSRYRSNSSSSSISSSSSRVHPPRTISPSTDGYKNLYQFLKDDQVPSALAPISSTSYKLKESQMSATFTLSNNDCAKSTMLKHGEKIENTFGSTVVLGVADTTSCSTIQSNHIIEIPLQVTDASYVNGVAIQMERKYENDAAESFNVSNENEGGQNIPLLEFVMELAEGYSYSEDLQQ